MLAKRSANTMEERVSAKNYTIKLPLLFKPASGRPFMPELDTTETIAELFQRAGSKPDTLTTRDLDRLIEHYRASRAGFKDKGTAATKTDKPAPDLKELGF
jgi:hypothetical protein